MIAGLLTIVMMVVFFKMIFQWIFGSAGGGISQFFKEVFSIIGKTFGFFLNLLWKLIRWLFRLLIYNPNRR